MMQRWTWRVVRTNKRESFVEVALPTAEMDIKAAYDDAIRVLSTKPPKEEKKVDAETAQEDYRCNFRAKCATSSSFSLLLIIIFFCMVC